VRLPRHCLTSIRLGVKSPPRLLRTRVEIKLIAASGLFNVNWYLENNDDVRRAHIEPLLHYLLFGGAEGRDPNPLFDSDWYLRQNSESALPVSIRCCTICSMAPPKVEIPTLYSTLIGILQTILTSRPQAAIR